MDKQDPFQEMVIKVTKRFITIFISIFVFFLLITIVIISLFYINETVTIEGVIEPSKYVNIRPEVSGILKDIFVNEGDYVTTGKLLVVIDDRDAKATLSKMETELEIGRNNLTQSEQELKLLQISNENSLQQAEISLKQANMELKNQIKVWEATKAIYARTAKELNLQDPEQEPLELSNKRIAYEQAELNLKMAISKKDEEKLKEIEVDNVKKNVSKIEDDLMLAKEKLERTKIYATQDGHILGYELQKLRGVFVTEGQTLFKIGGLSNWVVKSYITEQDLPKVKKGLKAKLYIKAYPYEKYKILNGEIEQVSISPSPIGTEASLTNANGVNFYTVLVKINDESNSAGKEDLTLYDGLYSQVKVITRNDRILSILLDKLFSTAGKLKSIPIRTSK